MDTKIINAYSEKSGKLLTSGLTIVDAAVEPLRVLRVLVEGLGPDVKAGLWLTNFRGIPVARTLSPFDLIYLDKDYRAVHCVEISTEGEYEPFKGDPASALVLPAKTIRRTKTRAGDRLMFRTVDAPSTSNAAAGTNGPEDIEGEQAGSPERPVQTPPSLPSSEQPEHAHFFNSTFPLPSAQSVGAPLDQFLSSTASSAVGVAPAANSVPPPPQPMGSPRVPQASHSGRLAKTAKSALGLSSILRPAPDSESPGAVHTAHEAPVPAAVEPAAHMAPAPVERMQSAMSPARVISSNAAHNFGAPPEYTQDSRTAGMPHSGRLMKGVSLAAAEMLPAIEPEPPRPEISTHEFATQSASEAVRPVPDAGHEVLHEATLARVIPITAAPHVPQIVHPVSVEGRAAPNPIPAVPPPAPAITAPMVSAPVAPVQTAPSTAMVPAPAAKTAPRPKTTTPVLQDSASVPSIPQISQPPRRSKKTPVTIVEAPLQPPFVEPAAALPSTANSAALPAKSDATVYPRTTDLGRAARKELEPAEKKNPSWDVRLLYLVFPEFDPSRPHEIRIPTAGEEAKPDIDDDEQSSTKMRFLCWLFPDLHLDKVKQKRSEERRAVRLPMPGLVAYFFTGGSPRPHPIRDISVTGFYMQTDERWLPGTIIRVTLQMVDSRGDGGRDSVTVFSRVVRWGPDGGGFEFVLPGFMET